MESYIEEFQNSEREKESDIVVVIGGPSKSGKSTLAEHVADLLGIEHVSAGDFFREIADEKGLSVEELSEQADKEIDVEVDRRTLETGIERNCVIDGRLAAWVLGDHADFSIYATAELEERAQRLAEIEDIPLEEAKEKVKKRDEDNNDRYERYYGIELPAPEMYDMILDNTELSIEKQNQLVEDVLEKRFPERLNEV